MQTALPKPLLPWDIMTCSGSRWTKSQGTYGNASRMSGMSMATALWNLTKRRVWLFEGDPSGRAGAPRSVT